MAMSRFITETELNPRIKLLKTVLGLIVILVMVVLYLVVALNWNTGAEISSISMREPADAYVSAVYGQLISGEGENQKRISAGESLLIGDLYKTTPGSAALVRFFREDIDILVSGEALFAIGNSLDPTRFNQVQGSARVDTNSPGLLKSPLEFGPVRLLPRTAGLLMVDSDGSNVTVMSGDVTAIFNQQEYQLTGGARLQIEEETAQVEQFSVLPAPALYSPAGGTVFRRSAQVPLQVEFIWEEVPEARSYLFEIARDRLFQSIVLQRTVATTSITVDNLAAGPYYWRVTSNHSQARSAGLPAEPYNFSVESMRNLEEEAVSAPELEIAEVSTQSRLISIRGKTEPGARIRIRVESFGRILIEPMEITVRNTGEFVKVITAPMAGQFEIFVDAYYRPEFVTTIKETIEVEF